MTFLSSSNFMSQQFVCLIGWSCNNCGRHSGGRHSQIPKKKKVQIKNNEIAILPRFWAGVPDYHDISTLTWKKSIRWNIMGKGQGNKTLVCKYCSHITVVLIYKTTHSFHIWKLSLSLNSWNTFAHILQGCFTGNGAITCQCSNPGEYW